MSKVFKHADDQASTRHALDVPLPGTEDLEFEEFYPAPFTRIFTSASQLSGSTGSTPRSSVLLSRHTSQTNITVPELKPSWDKATAPSHVEARAPNSQVIAGRTKGPFISILEEEEDDACGEAWGEYDSDDDDMLCIRRKRHAPPYNGLATSLVHNPYAAFLFQPSYKSPYLFPKVHRSVNAYYS
ncbi:hypothetical protein M407DRAFT_211294 [Tulasnella calospora MUT 4182]|uniref:Uncharacterized protein n=1 Tax=Tulasnella calospora MUT 4182 TaxID=1051891 RepID=A0A0C3KU34_9AGAM|nr:hypothetical protein M407DRAFT_211294 [Tulasnella calospora MUT 4182]